MAGCRADYGDCPGAKRGTGDYDLREVAGAAGGDGGDRGGQRPIQRPYRGDGSGLDSGDCAAAVAGNAGSSAGVGREKSCGVARRAGGKGSLAAVHGRRCGNVGGSRGTRAAYREGDGRGPGVVFAGATDGELVREIAGPVCVLQVDEILFLRCGERSAVQGGSGQRTISDDPPRCLRGYWRPRECFGRSAGRCGAGHAREECELPNLVWLWYGHGAGADVPVVWRDVGRLEKEFVFSDRRKAGGGLPRAVRGGAVDSAPAGHFWTEGSARSDCRPGTVARAARGIWDGAFS